MSLRRYNLNLLPVLDALLRHRSVTRAGQELGMSQSAASHALLGCARISRTNSWSRRAAKCSLTHRAEVIAGALPELLEIASRLLERDSFHPKHSVRTFKLGTADYVGLLLLPEITAKLPGVAPDIQMQLTWDRNDMPKKLRSGQLDFALMPRGTLDETDLHSETLFADELVYRRRRQSARRRQARSGNLLRAAARQLPPREHDAQGVRRDSARAGPCIDPQHPARLRFSFDVVRRRLDGKRRVGVAQDGGAVRGARHQDFSAAVSDRQALHRSLLVARTGFRSRPSRWFRGMLRAAAERL